MAEMILCPACGEVNPADREFCAQCQARLTPSSDAILPGQFPTKKVTAELEPVLPKWLRDARDQARQSAEEEPPPPKPAPQVDFLAGLQSQTGEDEEETPDWLASITGKAPKSKKAAEAGDVRWVELGKTGEFTQDDGMGVTSTQKSNATGENELPSWLVGSAPSLEGDNDNLSSWIKEASSRSETPTLKPAPLTESEPKPAFSLSADETPDWLKDMQAGSAASQQKSEALLDSGADTDWFNNLTAEGKGSEAPETPAWLQDAAAGTPPPLAPETPATADIPSWLRAATETTSETPSTEAKAEPAPENLPDWLKPAAPQPPAFSEEPPVTAVTDTPDWVSSLQQGSSSPAFEEETEDDGFSSPAFLEGTLAVEGADALFTEMPDWLSSVETGAPPAAEEPKEETVAPGALPSWVQAMRPVESSIQSSAVAPSAQGAAETQGALAGLHGVLPFVAGVGATSKPKAYSLKLQASEEQQSQAALLEQILAAETAPEPIAGFSPLVAQRGLRWILTALLLIFVGGVLFSRSRAFPLPESVPPPKSDPAKNSGNGVEDTLKILLNLPTEAPVLAILDYEPALAGEMEATAAPLMESMILLSHPALAIVSTNPVGGALADRLFHAPNIPPGGTESETRFILGVAPVGPLDEKGPASVTNLGYLPGGLAGVRAFAENPSAVVPFNANNQPAWGTGTALTDRGVSQLSHFAAIVLITDSADSARVWIEQTASKRKNEQGVEAPVIVIASAQAAPMIHPYYDSGQIRGLVAGLRDGAAIAQKSEVISAKSQARKYWDAFSVGMILAALAVVLGGLWSMALNVRDRVREGK